MSIIIISDTSYLILYAKIGRLDILKAVFTNIVVTQEVLDDFGQELDWLTIQSFQDIQIYRNLCEKLGKGEASAIALAVESPNSLLLIDEKKGLKIAESLGLNIIGSLGILLKAKEKKVIGNVEAILKLIESTDFRINPAIKTHILLLAGELNNKILD